MFTTCSLPFRNISRRKGFSILNVLGRSVRLAVSILILQHVKDELSYDDFREKRTNIYRVQFDAYRDEVEDKKRY